jgi:large subunit ribosomal protein L3
MKAILGKKIGMSQIFTAEGAVIPVTLVVAEPNKIMLRRTVAKDGHTAVQLGLPGRPAKEGAAPAKYPNELKQAWAARAEFDLELEEGAEAVSVEQFAVGDHIEVIGVSKGKGFQGVVKRHHFKGGPKSHGHRHVLRRPGSIGARFPQHVRKGMRMAGRMGGDQVTVKNLEIVAVDATQNTLAIKGAVPGKRGSVVVIKSI